MARHKMLTGQTQVALAQEYFESVCHKNLDRFTFLELAQYISENTGIEIKEHTVRRCLEVREFYNSIQQADNTKSFRREAITFKTLDIEAFLAQNSDIFLLRTALRQRDDYYQGVCATAAAIIKQLQDITAENSGLKKKCVELAKEVETLTAAILGQKIKISQLNELIKKMRDILDTNVYSEIAVELLKDTGLLKGSTGTAPILKEGAKEHFVLSVTSEIPAVVADDNAQGTTSKVVQGLFDKI